MAAFTLIYLLKWLSFLNIASGSMDALLAAVTAVMTMEEVAAAVLMRWALMRH
jgi:hypothetical protein